MAGQNTGARCSGGREDGSAIIIVMMFVLVMLGLGAALFLLVRTSIAGTELERKEVKAFNVAEAGVDAGMLALKLDWPSSSGDAPAVDAGQVRAEFPVDQFPDPSRSPAEEWLQVSLYDNSEGAPTYDANGDGRMVVDSSANVDDDRHRILLLAQRETVPLELPLVAMYAGSAGGNGHGLRVYLDPAPQVTPLPLLDSAGNPVVPAIWGDTLGKGIDSGPSVLRVPDTTDDFDSYVSADLLHHLMRIAQDADTYFDDDGGTPWPSVASGISLLTSGAAGGNVIWLKSDDAIEIAGTTQIGSRDNPVVLVLDTPSDVENGLDFRGTADFFGVVINLGGTLVRGTSGFFGSVISQGVIEAKGVGTIPEINYNGDVITRFWDLFTLSVAIVPNTWEEYTVPRSTTTTGG